MLTSPHCPTSSQAERRRRSNSHCKLLYYYTSQSHPSLLVSRVWYILKTWEQSTEYIQDLVRTLYNTFLKCVHMRTLILCTTRFAEQSNKDASGETAPVCMVHGCYNTWSRWSAVVRMETMCFHAESFIDPASVCSVCNLSIGITVDLMAQMLARRAEDRELPGFSPTQD